ncbi:hypothetical protein, partial [Oenococcus oeni]|uniref:hypothetical protein n=1 Tax=Oenococcus oeni TaxID=1247 RepID=UPI000AFF51B0
YADWNIIVNKTQSTLKVVVVTDQPSGNPLADPDSIIFYGTTNDSNGNVTENTADKLVEGTDYTVAPILKFGTKIIRFCVIMIKIRIGVFL